MNYKEKISQQIKQYANVSDMHSQLPSITDYWRQKYMKPAFYEVTGMNNHIEFYAKTFVDSINKTGNTSLISLGSGDGLLEVQIASMMKDLKCDEFTFNLIELSPFQISKAWDNVKAAGLENHFNIEEQDFNKWTTKNTYAGVMAHHALHHVLELEHLFEAIKTCLHDDGVFLTMDMIGRNGHMRWPETLEFIERIWRFLPEEKRHHTILKKTYDEFYNHDCSTQGFEGIRAQDILPLLVKNFNFKVFYAYGNITDEFVNRAYGANFDPNNAQDTAFIDFIEYLNSLLLELGHVKPTKMIAIMSAGEVKNTKYYKNLSPEFCIRKVDS